jgi:dihydroorotate dehydrogenase (fumarate)
MDLTTRYMGIELKNPLVASASPLTGDLGNIRRIEDAGAAAIVLPSIFEEQIEQEVGKYERLASAGHGFAETESYFPELEAYRIGPHAYLDLIRRASAAVDIPIVGSLNGTTDEGWIEYAKLIEEAGARGIELNIYFIPTDLTMSGRAVEARYLDILRAVQAAVSIPIAVKLSPYFTAMGHMAGELARAGADALVLFNRFYQPDIDLATLRVLPDLELSTPSEIRLPLLWIAILAGRIDASLAAATGVASAAEVVKYLLVGADAVMVTSALLRNGTGHMRLLLDGLKEWLAVRDIDALARIKGTMSQLRIRDADGFVRANYIKILQGYAASPGRTREAPL